MRFLAVIFSGLLFTLGLSVVASLGFLTIYLGWTTGQAGGFAFVLFCLGVVLGFRSGYVMEYCDLPPKQAFMRPLREFLAFVHGERLPPLQRTTQEGSLPSISELDSPEMRQLRSFWRWIFAKICMVLAFAVPAVLGPMVFRLLEELGLTGVTYVVVCIVVLMAPVVFLLLLARKINMQKVTSPPLV